MKPISVPRSDSGHVKAEGRPFFTVAIPTYRRPATLRRAISSVLAQTFADWELVVSDDEAEMGETWDLLKAVAQSDHRIRPIKNGSPHGATSNHNRALLAARGEWIKILHDDDVLKPHCLGVLANIVKQYPNVLAISCACEKFVEGHRATPFRRLNRAVLELMEPNDALVGMYLLDEAGWALPTQQLVHRSVVAGGVLFESPPGITTLYDSWFNAKVRARGPTLIYNLPLVEWHQGEQESTTSSLTDDELTMEFVAFRKLIMPLLPNDRKIPGVETVERMVAIIRGLLFLRRMHVSAAARIFVRIWDVQAYWLALGWLLRQYYPRRFSLIKRTPLWIREDGGPEHAVRP